MGDKHEKILEIDLASKILTDGRNGLLSDIFSLLDKESSREQGVMFRNGIVLILCRADGGRIEVDSKVYELSRSNLIILPENHIINREDLLSLRHSSVLAVAVDYILTMPSPIDTNIFNYSRYISVVKLSDEKFDDLQTYYRFIYKELREQSRYQREILQSIFYALVLEVLGEYEKIFDVGSNLPIRDDSLSDRFFRLLAQYYRSRRSVQFYAQQLNLTPKYLSTAIRRATGRPILEWIHEAVLIEAKMLLRSTSMTVQQISEGLNFSSPSAFVQFFKKHTGTTPRRL